MAAPKGWFAVEATPEELAAAGKLVVHLYRHEILLLWNDGEPVALSNVCIHRGRKLNEGVRGRLPPHHGQGQARQLGPSGAVGSHPVMVKLRRVV